MRKCVIIDVDGQPVRVQLANERSILTKEDLDALRELARAVREMTPGEFARATRKPKEGK